jgi:hypothetical protein
MDRTGAMEYTEEVVFRRDSCSKIESRSCSSYGSEDVSTLVIHFASSGEKGISALESESRL